MENSIDVEWRGCMAAREDREDDDYDMVFLVRIEIDLLHLTDSRSITTFKYLQMTMTMAIEN